MDSAGLHRVRVNESVVSGSTPTPETATHAFAALKRTGTGKLTGALNRWAGLGPYYAMFPMDFAMNVIRHYCPEGGYVLDPFAGRGTSVFAAAATGRIGTGIEIQDAGWLYATAKLKPAPMVSVLRRLIEINRIASRIEESSLEELPDFFRWCFCDDVLRFLLSCRRHLNWRRNEVDRTLTAFVLNNLHGDRTRSLSNQMHQARSMAPDYSVRWWKSRRMRPHKKDPVAYISARIAWRYKHGAPRFTTSSTYRGDSRLLLRRIVRPRRGYDLLFTSPPYFSIVNYHYDQWLRLWLLGGPTYPKKSSKNQSKGSFQHSIEYQNLLYDVFSKSAEIMRRGAAVYVRTDAREFSLAAAVDAMRLAFPGRPIRIRDQPYKGKTQTVLFGDKKDKPGEVDLIIPSRVIS